MAVIFEPTAFLVGSRSTPSQIALFALTGGTRKHLAIPLDLGRPPVTFAAQALAYSKMQREILFFGATTGFVVNYATDRAVRFDIYGNPVEEFNRLYEPGDASVSIGRKRLPTGFGFL